MAGPRNSNRLAALVLALFTVALGVAVHTAATLLLALAALLFLLALLPALATLLLLALAVLVILVLILVSHCWFLSSVVRVKDRSVPRLPEKRRGARGGSATIGWNQQRGRLFHFSTSGEKKMLTGDGSPVAFVASMGIAVVLILAIALMASVVTG